MSFARIHALLLVVLGSTAVTAQSSNLDAALQALQGGGNAHDAAQTLEKIAKDEPQNARAWRGLGLAYRKLQKPDAAIQAYQRALAIEPDSPQVFYALGVVYATRHDTKSAFEWLARARATHRFDMTQAAVDDDLAELRKDPRFSSLLPRPEDFDHPFVEPVRILKEWRGEAANDQFGWIARNIGDVDGDGINDVVTSAPGHGAQDAPSGRIYVFSTRSGKLLWRADGEKGDQLGSGIEAAGDTNHDGIPDVVASGPGAAGVARIYSGRDGRVLQTFKSKNAAEVFGNHVAGVGDFNRDGYADVLVGAPGKPGEKKVAGSAYLFSGKEGRLLLELHGERPGDQFGSAVSGHSDAKEQLLVIGAPGAGATHHGRVYVYRAGTAGPRWTFDADETGRAFGMMFLSIPGDLDGDGAADIYASDWSNAAKGPSTGRVYVYSGKTGAPLLTLTGETAGEGFGTSPSVAGDVDGDGRPDLIVGAWQYGGAAISGGRAYLYSGRDGKLLKTLTSRAPGDTFGFDAVGLGDVDGDGMVDLLITSGWSGVKGFHSGRVFVLSSGIGHWARLQ
jgi:hypothetical protein